LAADGFTIGEVLNQLKEEFEDITISKIRFLESEGLIYPDRTESGYRKFTEDDVDRLRFILTAQRDHYLPLKVIREQLERLDAGDPATPTRQAPPADTDPGDEVTGARAVEIARMLEAALSEDGSLLEQPGANVTLSLREFCEATGLDAAEVRSLRDYGIIGDRGEDGGPFDGDDLLAARAARDLLNLGLEPRHLRMYRQFVDRELALFEQLVTPLLRQRNPEARRQATRQLDKLATLTDRMKRSLLARALRGYVHGA
jgi:DNA-binding transcriptional MerR regulator